MIFTGDEGEASKLGRFTPSKQELEIEKCKQLPGTATALLSGVVVK